jgi:hypothetical protein
MMSLALKNAYLHFIVKHNMVQSGSLKCFDRNMKAVLIFVAKCMKEPQTEVCGFHYYRPE